MKQSVHCYKMQAMKLRLNMLRKEREIINDASEQSSRTANGLRNVNKVIKILKCLLPDRHHQRAQEESKTKTSG